ncbi:MAG: hypothetical protein NVS9B4_18640 [Candidatus Acidiferrum sp.]
MAGQAAKSGTQRPFFFLVEDEPNARLADFSGLDPVARRAAEFTARQYTLMRRSLTASRGYWATIPGTTHISFCDAPFSSPYRFFRRGWKSDHQRVSPFLKRYTLAFFDKYLKHREQSLLTAGPSADFPEVIIEAYDQQPDATR